MQIPLQVVYHQVDKSDAIDALIREQVDKLEQVCDHIIGCRVAVEEPHRHVGRGIRNWRVRISVTVPPQHELVVAREGQEAGLKGDLETVILDAFDSMLRKLDELSAIQSRQIKSHPDQDVQAFVSQLFDDYGFLRTLDDREIYFHRNSIISGDAFEDLRVGMGVSFNETEGDEGPQASSVRIRDRRGIVNSNVL